jgi:hypothetical protein
MIDAFDTRVAEELLEESGRTHRLSTQLYEEREAIMILLRTVREQQRHACYVCQDHVPLSMLVLNDRCHHSLCRVCFMKVTATAAAGDEEENNPLYYHCIACKTSPSVLAVLSPKVVKEYAETVGYRVQLIDN